jgi:putative spermidine/putrescine transport system permease protein
LFGFFMLLGLSFIYVPIAVIVVNSFNASRTFSWPPAGLTLSWWSTAFGNPGVRSALLTSLKVATAATLIALLLGTLASYGVSRYKFFGRDTVSLLILLPIALPGIVTGIALNSVFTTVLGQLSYLSLIAGHATFCVVVVFNNSLARLRRLHGNLAEASMDLGAPGGKTFWRVTFPLLRPALIAGGLLAFGLSFDEIIVTTFTAGVGIQTLPLWIYQNLFRPNQAPIVNVVAAALILVSIVPIYFAQRLGQRDALTTGGGA